MRRHKSCETECVLMRDHGLGCDEVCMKQELADTVFERKSPLYTYLKRKKKNR